MKMEVVLASGSQRSEALGVLNGPSKKQASSRTSFFNHCFRRTCIDLGLVTGSQILQQTLRTTVICCRR